MALKDWAPGALERVCASGWAKLAIMSAQMVAILSAAITDGIEAVERVCAEAFGEVVFSADSASTSGPHPPHRQARDRVDPGCPAPVLTDNGLQSPAWGPDPSVAVGHPTNTFLPLTAAITISCQLATVSFGRSKIMARNCRRTLLSIFQQVTGRTTVVQATSTL